MEELDDCLKALDPEDLALQRECLVGPPKFAKEQPYGPGIMIEQYCPFNYDMITLSTSDAGTDFWFHTQPIAVIYVDCTGLKSLSEDIFIYALRRAVQLNTNAVSLTWGPPIIIKPCESKPVPPMLFEAPDLSLPIIDFRELSKPIESFRHQGLDIVLYEGRELVHKYMWQHQQRRSFEHEAAVYSKVAGSQYVPEFLAMTRQDEYVRGFLLERIPGRNLVDAMDEGLTDDDRHALTANIIRALLDLEQRGFYPQDLKCFNVMRKEGTNDVVLIDFGAGMTPGWCDPVTQFKVGMGEVTPRDELYLLGKTIHELWTNDVPNGEVPDTVPESIRTLIKRCCEDRTDETIAELAKSMGLNP
jgi:predicted Ser/Thr protein kinase